MMSAPTVATSPIISLLPKRCRRRGCMLSVTRDLPGQFTLHHLSKEGHDHMTPLTREELALSPSVFRADLDDWAADTHASMGWK